MLLYETLKNFNRKEFIENTECVSVIHSENMNWWQRSVDAYVQIKKWTKSGKRTKSNVEKIYQSFVLFATNFFRDLHRGLCKPIVPMFQGTNYATAFKVQFISKLDLFQDTTELSLDLVCRHHLYQVHHFRDKPSQQYNRRTPTLIQAGHLSPMNPKQTRLQHSPLFFRQPNP